MGGINLVLNAAKDALLTQQYAIDVTSHNVANVNTPGYSRQTPIIEAKTPTPYAGYIFGRGVELNDIVRNMDSFIETRLRERNSDLTALSEQEIYLTALEGVFDETSDRSLSTQFADFFNAWQDLANNPSGTAERETLVEMASLLTQSFNDLSGDLTQFKREIGLSLDAGVDKVNQLTAQIAGLNEQIVNMEVVGSANDLRDQRDALVIELSQHLNVKAFESGDGNLMVMTTSGYTLVDKACTYQLDVDGTDITWEGSGNMQVAITDKIDGGKLGGWLTLQDEIIPKYEADLDELAQATIWEVNKIHSQGAGLEVFQPEQSVSGTYTVDSDGDLTAIPPILANSLASLNYGDKINFEDGSFTLWIGNENGTDLERVPIDITSLNSGLSGDSDLTDLALYINGKITVAGGGITASVADNALVLTADENHSFGVSEDSSHILAALGLNTFFEGTDALTMETNTLLDTNQEFVAAALINFNSETGFGECAVGDNSNALAMTSLQYSSVDIERWSYERGQPPTSLTVNDTLENYLHSFVGSLGVKSQSVTREKDYTQVIVEQLNATRDSISAVSLDEEMTSLIKYQQAYSAAAKLISTADEMYQTLLEVR